jgi:hypothetical protein
MSHRFYLLLRIYNYDAFGHGHQSIQHNVASAEAGKKLASRLKLFVPEKLTPTSRWLDRNHKVYGFIEQIVGVFEETTIKVG